MVSVTRQHVLGTVHVLATTIEGTRAAVRAALPVARQRRAPVVLLVEGNDWQTACCLRAARALDPSITEKRLVGSSATEAVKMLVPALALIVIGGPTRWWWPNPHQRLAARLQRHGRDVIFVGCATAPESPSDRPKAQHGSDLADVRRFAR